MDDDDLEVSLRWRLVLGRHAERPLPLRQASPDAGDEGARLDRALDFLYEHDQRARGHRWGSTAGPDGLTVPAWLHEVRTLFPQDTVEIVERDALTRFGLSDLLGDPALLQKLEPTDDVLRALLAFRAHLPPAVLPEAKRLVRRALDRITARLKKIYEPALRGRRSASRGPVRRIFRNVHWHRTLRRNLGRWDPERRELVPDRLHFHPVSRQASPWHVVVLVDGSGSMTDSLIHAAVTASILAQLPAVTVTLLLFDHRVVDCTGHVHDPLEVLFQAQLGGGTLLTPALRAAADAVRVPHRTLLAVVSDFFLGDPLDPALGIARELHDAGVKCLGLCALDAGARPLYDASVARALADVGWTVAAVTPERLAELLAARMR
jgi:Mg-chelatase subunit ChlD